MFNFFKKKQTSPISKIYSTLSINQKMSILNLLLTIGSCDPDESDAQKEMQFLNNYIDILGVNANKCTNYLENYGHDRIIEDLASLTKNQKELLIIAAWEMIICDGSPNETELNVTSTIFEKLGVSYDELIAIVEKSQAFKNYIKK